MNKFLIGVLLQVKQKLCKGKDKAIPRWFKPHKNVFAMRFNQGCYFTSNTNPIPCTLLMEIDLSSRMYFRSFVIKTSMLRPIK